MAETSAKAEMAKKVFTEVFQIFGWERRGTADRNWKCLTPEMHDDRKQHPSDLVCRYGDPYGEDTIYVNVDIKGLASSTIDATKIAAAMRSMALATHCLNLSEEWHDAYVTPGGNWRGVGLLFIYNNDGLFDETRFRPMLSTLPEGSLDISKGHRMFVVGPGDVNYLYTVAHDIISYHARYHCDHVFYYPHLMRKAARAHEWAAASLEMLTGPWQIVRLVNPQKPLNADTYYVVYVRSSGADFEEFAYLIDSFFRFQILRENVRIDVRLPHPDKTARERWDLAVDFYAKKYHGMEPAIKQHLAQVTCSSVTSMVAKFSETEVGMDS